jgi:hypothetical protein
MNVKDLGVLREAPCGQELRGLGLNEFRKWK